MFHNVVKFEKNGTEVEFSITKELEEKIKLHFGVDGELTKAQIAEFFRRTISDAIKGAENGQKE